MLAVITAAGRRPDTPMGRLLDRFVPLIVRESREELLGTEVLRWHCALDHRGRPNEGRLCVLAESLRGRCLTAAPGVELPRPLLSRLSGTEEIEAELVGRGALALVQGCRMPMGRKTVGLLDPEGRETALAAGLLRYAGEVRVLTHAPDRYEEVSRQLLEELGAPLTLSEDPCALRDCLFTAVPRPVRALPLTGPVLTMRPLELGKEAVQITAPEPDWPRELERWRELGISPMSLLGALHRQERAPDALLTPVRGCCCGRILTFEEISGCLQRRTGKNRNIHKV